MSSLTNQVFTRYSDTISKSNLVTNLIFLWSGLSELNNHLIHPDWWLTSDHAPLTISISIVKENINSSSSLLQRTVKKKHCSSKISCLLSRISMSPTYLTSTILKTLSTYLFWILNIYREIILSSSILQDILRAGGMRNVINPWETIEHQEILKTGRSLRKWSKLLSSSFSILKSKKSPTKNKDLGNS